MVDVATTVDVVGNEVVDPLRPPAPTELQVEVTGSCNLQCRMCLVRYRPPKGRVSGSMTFDEFQRVVEQLPSLRRLTLQGLGEPLLAPDLRAFIAWAGDRDIEVGFNTNGMLLDRARATDLLRARIAWLHVSLDGARADTVEHIRDGADFERIVANLRTLVGVREAEGSARPRIQLNAVAMRSNVDELPDLVRLAADIGVDRLWVQNLSHDFSDENDDAAFRDIAAFTASEALWGDLPEAIRTECARLGDELALDVRLPADAPSRPRAPGQPGCDWPWRSAYVGHDGRVQPCCMLMGSDRGVVGDLRDQSFAELWHGEAYRRLREGLLGDEPPTICNGCSAYRGVF